MLGRIAERAAAATAGVLIALIGVLVALMGLGFLAHALHVALVPQVGPALAAALTGGAVLLLAVLLLAVAALVARQGTRRRDGAPPRATGESQPRPEEVASVLGEQAAALLRDRPKTSAGAALAAGFAVGASPELRRLLGGLIPSSGSDDAGGRDR